MADGVTRWLIPDAYIPTGGEGDLASHEAVCVLNTGETDATLRFLAYFEDREPLGPFTALVPAGRTRHLRTDGLVTADGDRLPRDVPYALAMDSDRPVTVQYSRLDSRAPALALMTTVAFPGG